MSESPSRRVLLVEDDDAVRRVIGRLLMRGGYATREASDGERAVELFGDGSDFDVVVLDLTLPKVSGEAVLEAIRACSQLPVVVLTGQLPEEPLAGATLVLEKPIEPRKLLAELAKLVGG